MNLTVGQRYELTLTFSGVRFCGTLVRDEKGCHVFHRDKSELDEYIPHGNIRSAVAC